MRNRRSVRLPTIVVVFALLVTAPGVFATSAQLLIDVGLNHFYKKRYLEAFQSFKQAVETDPRNPEARYNLARVYKIQGFYREAAQELMLALQLQPGHAAAARELAEIKALLERDVRTRLKIEGKQTTLDQAVADVGRDAQQERGQKLLAKGDLAGAAVAFEAALGANPYNPKLHAVLGYIYFQLNRYTESLARYQKAVELAPQDPENHYALGLIQLRTAAPRQAIGPFQQALALAPGLVKAHYSLGEAYEQLEQSEDALFQFRRCLQLNPGLTQAKDKLASLGARMAFQYFNRGVAYYQKGDYDKAEALLGLALQYGNLNDSQRQQAQEMQGTAKFWIAKAEKERAVREQRREIRQDSNIAKTVRVEEVALNPEAYRGLPVTWEGYVAFVDSRRGRDRYFANSNPDVKVEDNMDYLFGVTFPKDLPSDRRISEYSHLRVKGKVTGVEKVLNTSTNTFSSRPQPVVEATEVIFTRETESSEPLTLRFY